MQLRGSRCAALETGWHDGNGSAQGEGARGLEKIGSHASVQLVAAKDEAAIQVKREMARSRAFSPTLHRLKGRSAQGDLPNRSTMVADNGSASGQ